MNPQVSILSSIRLLRSGFETESGLALEIWSGFHREEKGTLRRFLETMGYSPRFCSDPNVGKPDLFIGLMLRFDVLDRMGEIDQLVTEMKNLYLPELRIGPGTLFEHYNEWSGCHGFNAAAGAFLTNSVLGVGAPLQGRKTICISPHPGKLLWAAGTAKCGDGYIFMDWDADQMDRTLNLRLSLPEGWEAEYEFPAELSGWTISVNGRRL